MLSTWLSVECASDFALIQDQKNNSLMRLVSHYKGLPVEQMRISELIDLGADVDFVLPFVQNLAAESDVYAGLLELLLEQDEEEDCQEHVSVVQDQQNFDSDPCLFGPWIFLPDQSVCEQNVDPDDAEVAGIFYVAA